MNNISSILQKLTYVVIIIGAIMYYGEKKMELGDKFTKKEFILGSATCKLSNKQYKYSDVIKTLL